MISLIEVLNYRCLRYVRQPLGRFHVLVGPNASGKTTFLDAVSFLSDLVADGLDEAVRKRTQNLRDLTWQRDVTGFEIAVEATIPGNRRRLLAEENQRFDTIRYEVSIGFDPETSRAAIRLEQAFLKFAGLQSQERFLFQVPRPLPIRSSTRRGLARGRNSSVRPKPWTTFYTPKRTLSNGPGIGCHGPGQENRRWETSSKRKANSR